MELVKLLWGIIFFFFVLVLLFTWSKTAVIKDQLKRLAEVFNKFEELDKENTDTSE